jgi:nucleoside-diphosphate-sugar epimerase
MTYYENNVLGMMRLVLAMKRANVKRLVFSSSATVCGIPAYLPLDEKRPLERYAGPTFAKEAFGWKSVRSLEEMCADHRRWQLKNPNGHRGTQRHYRCTSGPGIFTVTAERPIAPRLWSYHKWNFAIGGSARRAGSFV